MSSVTQPVGLSSAGSIRALSHIISLFLSLSPSYELSLSLSLSSLSLSLQSPSLLFACAVAHTRLHPLRAERLEFRSIERKDRWSKIGIRAERRADSANEDFDRGGGCFKGKNCGNALPV